MDTTSEPGRHGLQPLQLSPSAVHDFLSCRLRYALTYLSPLAAYEREPVTLLGFGDAIHKSIADFHRLGGWEQVSADELVTILGSHWPDNLYQDAGIARANFGRALEMLERFYANRFPESVVQELGVERKYTWKRFRRGILAVGRIDRACQLADGTIMLLDYKTSDKPRAVEDLKRDPQAIIYRSLGSEAFRHVGFSRMVVAFYYLPVGRAVTVDFEREEFFAGWTRIDRVANHIREGQAAVVAGVSVARAFPPSRGEQCSRCPIRRACDGLASSGAFDAVNEPLEGGAS